MTSEKSFEKSFSQSETDILMASTDTLVNKKKGLPEELRHDMRKFGKFIWDPTGGRVMKRTDDSWARLILFILAFLTGLSLYSVACFAMYLEVFVDKNKPGKNLPYLPDNNTILAGLPGLGYRPMPDYRTTLIRFEQGKPASYKPMSDHIQSVLLHYENFMQESESFVDCNTLKYGDERNKEKSCRFNIGSDGVDTEGLGPECTWQQDFGYDAGQPCVLLKLNKIYGWEPKLFNITELPAEMENRSSIDHIGVSCVGENPIDQENMGPLKYWPQRGFPWYFYPYKNQEGYLSPLMFIKFMKPVNGIVINVWCRAWAKNIRHHRQDDFGSIHFEILID